MPRQPSIAKITRPRLPKVLFRKRLFSMLDKGRSVPLTWVSGPGGSGKTTLVASWLDARKLPCLWYQLDEGDGDIATFFYYLGLAAKKAAPRFKKPLPLLTPEYMRGIPAFTKRYFENLCTRLHPPFVIVLDNYHHVAPDSLFHDVVRDALFAIPEEIAVIIMSRSMPPPTLALLQTYNKIHSIGWKELKFDLNETRALFGQGQGKSKEHGLSGRLHRITEGWAAGLVLLMERLRRHSVALHDLGRFKPGELFDYFATEIFAKTDDEAQSFLLKTSFLPRISPRTAKELTNNENADTLLAALSRNHFFTEQRSVFDPVYQYHPLFQEFLQARARENFPHTELLDILRCAAVLLERTGQVEDAADLFRQAEEWEGLSLLILANAKSMVTQGRNRSLEEWLKSLPEKILNRDPRLLYWKGICRMPYGLSESREWIERAFEGFKRKRDPAGLYLSWSGIIDTFVYEWGSFHRLDHWITEFKEMRTEYPDTPSPEIEARMAFGIFCALMHRQTHHPDLPYWAKRVQEIVNQSSDIRLQTMMGNQLILYYLWWSGDLAKAAVLVETLRTSIRSREADNLPFIIWRGIEGIYYWMTAENEKCIQAVNEGIETADDTGMHIWDFMLYAMGAAIAITLEDNDEAWKFLDKMKATMDPSANGQTGMYHYFAAFASLQGGEPAVAVEHGRSSFVSTEKAGFPFGNAQCCFALCAALLDANEREEGLKHLAKSLKIARTIKCTTAEYLCLITEAWYFLSRGENVPGVKALAGAMKVGREQGFVNHAAWRRIRMSFLCAKSLELGIETTYVKDLIKRRSLVPPEPSVEIEEWPWRIKVYTLGIFEIITDGIPFRFTGKAQKKPLEMLKILIALGGKDVSEAQITDVLWPDVDGDLARCSFDTTLHRLRKLVGNDDFIQVGDGQLTLDARHCWVDSQAFERIFEDAMGSAAQGLNKLTISLPSRTRACTRCNERLPRIQGVQSAGCNPKSKMHPDLIEKALSLYKGHFLPAHARAPWALSMRERLRTKFLRLIIAQGRHWEEARRYQKAVDCYERGLETDSCAEEFYQRLMIAYARRGQQAEAAKVYHRCKMMLTKSLGLAPSSKTEDIYASLRKKKR